MRTRLARSSVLMAVILVLAGGAARVSAGVDERKVAGYVNNKSFAWKAHDTQHFRIYAESGTYADTGIEGLKDRIETIRANTLKFIGSQDKKPSFVFLLDSRQRMKDLTGDEVNGMSIASKGAVFMVVNSTMRGVPHHEFFHLFAWRHWRLSKEVFVSEGMAVYSDDRWHSYELHPLAQFLKVRGKLIPMKQLTESFRRQNDLISYPQAGSFMKYLSERYGKEKVVEIWKGGEKAFAKAYGKNLDQLEQEWLAFIDGQNAIGIKYQGW